jgi:methylated-DNA-[protein]-cysteine S-methyltransferase
MAKFCLTEQEASSIGIWHQHQSHKIVTRGYVVSVTQQVFPRLEDTLPYCSSDKRFLTVISTMVPVKSTATLSAAHGAAAATWLSPKQAMLLRTALAPEMTGVIVKESIVPLTAFQSKVYTALCRVPKGKVTTYKHLAEAINSRSSRSIGQALRRNPHAPIVPCHRVVSSNRTLGGFHGRTAGPWLTKKEQLLRDEGVEFDDEGKIHVNSIYSF